MKKKKIILGSILAATAVLGVAGCKKDKKTTTPVDSTTTPVVESSTKTPTPTPNNSTSPVESSKNDVSKYDVTYNIKGHGTQPDNLTDVTNLPSELPTLTDNDYNFDGWYIDEEYTTKAEAGSLLTGDITLYAKWSLKEGQNENPDDGNNNQGGNTNPDDGNNDQGGNANPDDGNNDQGGNTNPDDGNNDQGGNTNPGGSGDSGEGGSGDNSSEDNTIKFGIIYNNNGLGVKPEDVSEVSAITTEHLTGLTEKYCTFINWYLDADLTIAATADCDVTNYIQDGNVTLYAKWEKSAYYEFIHQDGLVYENHFDNADETIVDTSTGSAEKGYWGGTASKGSFTEANKVTISNGSLLLTDTDTSLNTSAILKLDAIYASKVEIITSIKMSKVSGKWNLLNILDDSGNSIFAIRTDDTNKNIGYTITGDKAVDTGVSYTVNSSVDLKITLDLINSKASIIINNTKTIEDIALDSTKILNVSQIKLITATDARNIEMDYLAIRSYDEDTTTLKTTLKTQLETKYNTYQQEEYTTNYESLTSIYNTAISAIDAATSATEAVSTYNKAITDLAAVKSDAIIALDAIKEAALNTIETQYNSIINNYTIIVDSNNEDDTYENKTSLEEAFTNVKANINNAKSEEEIQEILEEFTIDDIQDDNDLLETIADELFENLEEYLEEKGPFNYNEEQILAISDELYEKYEVILSNSELTANEKKAKFFEELTSSKGKIDLVLNDTAQLAKDKADAISEISSYKSTEIEEIKESHEEEYNEIVSIKNGAADLINACTSPSEVSTKKDEIKESIDTLYNAASMTIEDLRADAKSKLESYKDGIIGDYDPEEDAILIAAIEEIYTNTDYSSAENAAEINEITSSAKSQIQQLVTRDTLAKRKVSAKEEIEELSNSIKDELYSNELKEQVDTKATEILSKIDSYDNIDDLNGYITSSKETLQNILDEADSYEFTITYRTLDPNVSGTISVVYGNCIDLDDIHVTAMKVIGAKFSDERDITDVKIYDDTSIDVELEDKDDIITSSNWKLTAEDNTPTDKTTKIIDNDLITLDMTSNEWVYYSASYSGYVNALQSANVANTATVLTININENLSNLKLVVGYADSTYKIGRSGTLNVKINDTVSYTKTESQRIKPIYTINLDNLKFGDVIEVELSNMNTGSRLYLFEVDATIENDTPKLVNVIYNGDTTKYSYLDEIELPDSSDIDRFAYWYYLDNKNNEHEVSEGTKLSSGTNIELKAKLHDYNVFITYMNGEETYQEQTQYAIWEGNTAISKPETNPTDGNNQFLGWYLLEGESNYTEFDFENVVAGTYTLYAKFAESKTVSFDWNLPLEDLTITDYTLNGETITGSEISSIATAKLTLDLIPSNATLAGYRFLGWSFENTEEFNLITEAVDITDDATIYARWVKTYIVSFNTNGGSSVANQIIDENGIVTQPESNPEKSGYDFAGWYSDSDYTIEFNFESQITEDTTIYAKWDEIQSLEFSNDSLDSSVDTNKSGHTLNLSTSYFTITSKTNFKYFNDKTLNYNNNSYTKLLLASGGKREMTITANNNIKEITINLIITIQGNEDCTKSGSGTLTYNNSNKDVENLSCAGGAAILVSITLAAGESVTIYSEKRVGFISATASGSYYEE